MTKDHTLIAQEIEKGNLTPEQAKRSNIRHFLTRCIGVEEQANADFYTGEVLPGDSFLLCSDGFYHKVSLDEIWNTVYFGHSFDPNEMKDREQFLTETDKQRGEKDNISVITVHVQSDSSSRSDQPLASFLLHSKDDDVTIMMSDDCNTCIDSGAPVPAQFGPGSFYILKDISLFAPADPRALAMLTS